VLGDELFLTHPTLLELRNQLPPHFGPRSSHASELPAQTLTFKTPFAGRLLQGHRVRFVVAADLVNQLVAAQAKNTLGRTLAAWGSYELLLIDELGYLSFDSRGADLLYQVFNRRYQRGSTIVTTNLPFKEWGKLFSNSAAASAIADRLVHRGLLIRIDGKSRRSDQTIED
jgi:DNA replication protein DnaC